MKKCKKLLKILLIGIALIVSLSLNVNEIKANNYMHVLDILNCFDEASFIGLDDIDITSSELETIKGYFEKENIISDAYTKEKNHENIYKWIKSNIEYSSSSNRAYDVFINKKGVCEGFSQLYKVLCHLCKISNVISNGKTSFGAHAWNYIYLDKWYEIDITNSIYDDIFKNDLKDYQDEYLTPYLYKDNDFIYYYSHGVCAKPINSNANIPNVIKAKEEVVIDCYDEYLPHLISGYINPKIKSLTIKPNCLFISKDYFKSFSNLTSINGKYSDNGIYINDGSYYIPPKIEKLKIGFKNVSKETIKDLECLKSIEFLEGVETIENDAIINCPSLEQIVFPSSLNKIDFVCDGNILYVCKNDVAINYAISNNLSYIDQSKTQLPSDEKETDNVSKVIIITLGAIGFIFITVVLVKSMKE